MATDFTYGSLASLLSAPVQATPSYQSLSTLAPQVQLPPPMWIAVRQRFTQFNANLTLTPLQQSMVTANVAES